MTLIRPTTDVTRPITDRVKESLFNVLQNYDLLNGSRVADLFCGVGSLGLEALSRGAASVTFVERNAEIIDTLERNIARAAFASRCRIVRASAFRVGAALGPEGQRHDLVFVDPPYAATRDAGAGSSLAELLGILEDQVAAGGVLVIRTHRGVSLLDAYGSFHVIDRRRWGTMSIVLLQARANEQQANGH